MNLTNFQKRHLHYQVLFEYALLEYEMEQKGKEPPRIPLKEPALLLKEIKMMRQNLNPTNTSQAFN